MALPAGILAGAGKLLASDVVVNGLPRASSDVWQRVFPPKPPVTLDEITISRLATLIENLPDKDEIARAFAVLEARQTAMDFKLAESARRTSILMMGMAAVQIILLIVILVRS